MPLGAPLGPLLTYFSVVVLTVRPGDKDLPSETTFVWFAGTRYSTWGESARPPRLGVALLETLVWRSSRRASKLFSRLLAVVDAWLCPDIGPP